jgi:hypothetical protein
VAILGVATIVSPDDGCLTERGRIPLGRISAVTIDPRHLVYGSGSALVVDDVSDPRFPRREGVLDLGAQILDLEIQGWISYAATGLGLHIIDTRIAASPRQEGFVTTPHLARSVQVHENRAYVVGGAGLSMIQVADPASPRLVWSGLSPNCDYQDLELQYPLLFAVGCGLQIMDVSNPLFTTTLARLNVNASAVAVEGTTVAVTDFDRLRLIDISDPSNPVVRGSAWTHGLAKDAVVTGSLSVASSDTGLTIVGITSLDSPVEIAHLGFAGGATSIAVADGLVYAANRGFLRVVNLDDPAAPSEIGQIGSPSFARVAVYGRLAVTTHSFYAPREDAVTVIDIGRRGPTETGIWEAIWGPEDVDVVGSVAFVTADGGLYALDLSDSTNPVELSFLDLIESQYLAVDSDRAYIATMGAAGFSCFQVVDVSDPTDMYEKGRVDWDRGGPYPTAVDAAGNTAVIADSRGLRVLDVSDPWRPIQVGQWEREGAKGVALVGGHAVVGFSSPTDPEDNGVSVIDLSSVGGPVAIGIWMSPSGVTAVAEYDGAVLVGSESDGVFLIDLSEPSRPTEIGHATLGQLGVVDLAAAWPAVVATSGAFGLTVISLDRSCVPPRRPSKRVAPSRPETGYVESSAGSAVSPS